MKASELAASDRLISPHTENRSTLGHKTQPLYSRAVPSIHTPLQQQQAASSFSTAIFHHPQSMQVGAPHFTTGQKIGSCDFIPPAFAESSPVYNPSINPAVSGDTFGIYDCNQFGHRPSSLANLHRDAAHNTESHYSDTYDYHLDVGSPYSCSDRYSYDGIHGRKNEQHAFPCNQLHDQLPRPLPQTIPECEYEPESMYCGADNHSSVASSCLPHEGATPRELFLSESGTCPSQPSEEHEDELFSDAFF